MYEVFIALENRYPEILEALVVRDLQESKVDSPFLCLSCSPQSLTA